MNCANCKLEKLELLFCSACKKEAYCGKNCQVTHWKIHKLVCNKPPIKNTENSKQDNLIIKSEEQSQFDQMTKTENENHKTIN